MKVLVTGAAGFLGSHVVRALARRSFTVRALARPARPRAALSGLDVEIREGDLLDESSLRNACRGVEAVVHCAARVGYWSRIAHEQRAVNVEGTARLLRAMVAADVGRCVHVSSIATIGFLEATRTEPPQGRLDESHVWNPYALRIGYVSTKKDAEERALAAAWAGLHVVVVNPCMLLGPRFDGAGPGTLVRRIGNGALKWIPPGGTSVADVEDVAAGCVRALERGRRGERYILGGHNLSWCEFYALLARELGVRAPTRRMPMGFVRLMRAGTGALDAVGLSRPRFAPELYRAFGRAAFVDSSKAARELDYAFRSLDETVRREVRGVAGPSLRVAP